MTISSTANGFRPGVVTSTNRPTNPYDGQVIYETDTDRVLVWDNAAWVDPSTGKSGKSGLVLVHSQDFSAADPLDITGIFTSDFRNYKMFLEVRGTAGTALNMQFFSGTNTLYNSAQYYRYGTSYTTGGSLGNLYQATQTAWAINGIANSTTDLSYLEMTIFSPNIANRVHGIWSAFDGANGNVFEVQGLVNQTAIQFTGIRLDAASGTITGTIRVYGYNQ